MSYTYFWSATSLWASTADRAHPLEVPRRVSELDTGEKLWERMAPASEFADVVDDPEFREAAVGG